MKVLNLWNRLLKRESHQENRSVTYRSLPRENQDTTHFAAHGQQGNTGQTTFLRHQHCAQDITHQSNTAEELNTEMTNKQKWCIKYLITLPPKDPQLVEQNSNTEMTNEQRWRI